MRTELRDFIQNLFARSRFVELGIFDRAYIERLVNEHSSGKIDHNYRLWLLINLEVWYRLNFEGMGVESVQEEIEQLLGNGAVTKALRSAAE
jgi:asparagine synthase (glutamine-hydrolysing)